MTKLPLCLVDPGENIAGSNRAPNSKEIIECLQTGTSTGQNKSFKSVANISDEQDSEKMGLEFAVRSKRNDKRKRRPLSEPALYSIDLISLAFRGAPARHPPRRISPCP